VAIVVVVIPIAVGMPAVAVFVLAGSSGSGTMIRCTGDKKLFQCSGERRKIGRLAKANLTVRNQAGRYEPEGLRNPEGERRLENRRRVPKSDLATGFVR
jgi:hypothetical protein